MWAHTSIHKNQHAVRKMQFSNFLMQVQRNILWLDHTENKTESAFWGKEL